MHKGLPDKIREPGWVGGCEWSGLSKGVPHVPPFLPIIVWFVVIALVNGLGDEIKLYSYI